MARKHGAGALRALPSGRYQAKVRFEGKLIPAPSTFDSRQDAEAWLARAQRDIKRGKFTPPVKKVKPERLPEVETVSTYARRWLRDRDLKPKTRADYDQLLTRWIEPDLGDVPIKDVSVAMVRTWFADVAPGRETTRARAYGLLRVILNSAVDDELLSANPARIRGAGSVKRAKTITTATVEEVAIITGEMPDHLRCMVLLASWCGLRFGEIAELRRSDIDLDANVVRVRRGVTRVEGEHIVSTPKTEAAMRDVVIPPHVVGDLQDHLDQFTGPEPGDLLFRGSRGGHISPSTFYAAFFPARAAADRADLRFHDLRHTQAVLLAQNGATLADLMSRLGHSTPQAAMRYQHAVEERDRMLAERLSESANVVSLDARRAK